MKLTLEHVIIALALIAGVGVLSHGIKKQSGSKNAVAITQRRQPMTKARILADPSTAQLQRVMVLPEFVAGPPTLNCAQLGIYEPVVDADCIQ